MIVRKRPPAKAILHNTVTRGILISTTHRYNITHSRIRVYVENAIRRARTYRIMGDRYRNPLRKYDLANSIVCGLVNERTLARIAAAA